MNTQIESCLKEAIANEQAANNLLKRGDWAGAHALRQLALSCLEEAIELETTHAQ